MDIKTIFVLVSSILGIICFAPYIRDIFRGTTKPHPYTWLIWGILQGTAAADMWSGGAGYAIASSTIGAVLNIFVFLLSLRYGTKNITKFDTICLIGAVCAFGTYFFLQNALLSVFIIMAVDFFAFLPTLRKSYAEPETETASTHFLSGTSNVFAIAGLSFYSLTTASYLVAIMLMDYVLGLTVIFRKRI